MYQTKNNRYINIFLTLLLKEQQLSTFDNRVHQPDQLKSLFYVHLNVEIQIRQSLFKNIPIISWQSFSGLVPLNSCRELQSAWEVPTGLPIFENNASFTLSKQWILLLIAPESEQIQHFNETTTNPLSYLKLCTSCLPSSFNRT